MFGTAFRIIAFFRGAEQISSAGVVGEERKFPSSPATAKISGPQLHFGWAPVHH